MPTRPTHLQAHLQKNERTKPECASCIMHACTRPGTQQPQRVARHRQPNWVHPVTYSPHCKPRHVRHKANCNHIETSICCNHIETSTPASRNQNIASLRRALLTRDDRPMPTVHPAFPRRTVASCSCIGRRTTAPVGMRRLSGLQSRAAAHACMMHA